MHDPRSRVIPACEYRRIRWRNGEGWTREIHVEGAADDWTWRLSIAEIERDSAFSVFPGIDRELMLLSGNGMRLCFDDGEAVTLLPPHDRHRFAGERALRGELLDGPTHDFNLMWRRDRIHADTWHRPLVGPMVIFVEPCSTWALHLIAGQATFDASSGLPDLEPGDTALLVAGGARRRFALEGGGELLLARFTPA